jgi:hypothetical protein
VQLGVGESLQYLLNMLQMLLLSATVNHDVVEVDQDKLVNEGAEDVVHESLKGVWSRCQAEGHHSELIVAIAGGEGGFVDVIWCQRYLMIAREQVHRGEVLCTLELIQSLINAGKIGIRLLDDNVECYVVDTEAQSTIGLLSKDNRNTIS